MATAPSYITNNGINAGNLSNSRTMTYPAGIAADQIAILQTHGEGSTYDINTPTGWNLITTFTKAGASYTIYGAWFWKRLTGSETSFSLTRGSSTGLFAGLISTWANAVTSGTPLEYVGPNTGNSATVSSTAITPTINYCCVVNFTNFGDNFNIATLGGGNYAERYDLLTGAGVGCGFSCNSFGQTTAALEAARTGASGGAPSSDPWGTLTLALYPGWRQNKIIGVSLGGISKVNGVLKSQISKIDGV